MNAREQHITSFLKSRLCAWMLMIAALCASWFALPKIAESSSMSPDLGIWLPSAATWIPASAPWHDYVSYGSSIAATVLTMLLMALMNRGYSLLRTSSILFLGVFLWMQCAFPQALDAFGSGSMLPLVVLSSAILLYSTYMEPRRTKRIFLAMCLIGAGALADYAFLAYIPAMFIGCAQMRSLSLRAIIASVLGLITPLWILVGFGAIDLTSARLPEFGDMLDKIRQPDTIVTIVGVAFTLVIGLVAGTSNLVHVFRYNAKARAFNGFFTVISITTGLLCLADPANLTSYIPMLNCCVAFQTGLFFRINADRRAYLLILLIIAVYAAIYASMLWL